MENVILIIHLLLALCLIGVVLLQRSEGGGLGMGGGGGGAMTGRAAATALGKVTWVLAIAFICTSITLTIIAAQKSAGTSVLDRVGGQPQRTGGRSPWPRPAICCRPPAGDSAPLVAARRLIHKRIETPPLPATSCCGQLAFCPRIL